MSQHEQHHHPPQVATLPQQGRSHALDREGKMKEYDDLELHNGSLWHLLRAKTLAPSTATTTSPAGRTSGKTNTTSPPTSPHAAAVVELSRSRRTSMEREDRLEGEDLGDGGVVTTSLSLRAMLHEASALAALLRSEGHVAPGDRVAILLRNSPLFVVAQYAVAGAGAIAVNCNTRLTAPELRTQFTDAAVKVVIADDDFAHTLALALRAPDPEQARTTPLAAVNDLHIATADGDDAGDAGSRTSAKPGNIISPASVLVLWAPVVQQQQLETVDAATASSSAAAAAAAARAAAAAGRRAGTFDRQRRLVFDSAAYDLVCSVDDVEGAEDPSSSSGGTTRVSASLRLPWTPEEEELQGPVRSAKLGPRELGARYFQMMFTSGTTVGRSRSTLRTVRVLTRFV